MAYPGLIEDIKTCIRGGRPDRLPVMPMSQPFDARMAGMSYEEFATDARKVVRCHREVIRRFDYDWSNLHIDAGIEPEVFGVAIGPKKGGKGEWPWVPVGHLPATERTLAGLSIPDPQQDGRMPLLLEAINSVRAEFGDTVCVMGRVTAPFTMLTYLFGAEQGLVLLYEDSELVRRTMDFLLEAQTKLALAQLEAGAHAILICDLNCSSRLVSVSHYRDFVFDINRRLVSSIHGRQGMVFHHPNDPSAERLRYMADIGSDVITVGDGADIVAVREQMGDRICLMGNVDPIPFFGEGTPEMMEAEVRRIIDGVSVKGGHILSSGAAIPVESKPENMAAFVQTAREYWAHICAASD